MSENCKCPEVAPGSFPGLVREEEARSTNWGQIAQDLEFHEYVIWYVGYLIPHFIFHMGNWGSDRVAWEAGYFFY